MKDISLFSKDELLDELQDRTECFVCAYTVKDPQEKDLIMSIYGNGGYVESMAIAAMLQNDIINNWDGKMKTLQRIHDEESR